MSDATEKKTFDHYESSILSKKTNISALALGKTSKDGVPCMQILESSFSEDNFGESYSYMRDNCASGIW
jgi:hypothetical protein